LCYRSLSFIFWLVFKIFSNILIRILKAQAKFNILRIGGLSRL